MLHNISKIDCKDCGGSRLCERKRRRSDCIECGGDRICEHKQIRSRCKECGGDSVCVHSRRRSDCKECGGDSIREHSRRRSDYKECKKCTHDIRTCNCMECAQDYMDHKSVVSSADYGSREDTETLKECRSVNNVVCTKAQKDSAFGHHAAGILADYYIEGSIKNNLGHPSPNLDFLIACSIEESKALGSGYIVSYFLCIY